ncbi:MAG: GDYXXLXY domain-containing protein [Cyclobacteriaceae bacterium]
MKTWLVILFSLACISQWYVPASMIVEQENILSNGKTFRFKTAPVDPSDPFRGKYITLSFEADNYKNTNGHEWERGQKVFVIINEDDKGFARISDITETLPDPGKDYVQAEVGFSNDDEMVRVEYPFQRFYLEESKASDAEKVYGEGNRSDSSQTTYAVVRVKNGRTALEDVMINDNSIVDIVRELNEAKD